ncbi:hypothetical protein QTO34_005010 [Cnephaeus nilssonii]|uniref:Mediator of RNA polymerase II transcription subunit 22 n=1 Tax=Cnephaeus nilssonii TaxID=3371016 RepID=A0AA40HNS0_CNENI|nr:hypothetical protein QTO34_005010 [Eptesicus nilssonii]
MAQQRALPQSKETLLQSYNKRLKDDIKSIMDNFTEIIKTAKIEDETQVSRATQGEQDNYEMHVRAANIVRAGESLMKLVSDLKQFLILNDFPSVNEAIDQRNQQLRALQESATASSPPCGTRSPSTSTSWRRSTTRPAPVSAKLTICLCAKLTGGWTSTQTLLMASRPPCGPPQSPALAPCRPPPHPLPR